MSKNIIPFSTIGLISDFLSNYETHASIDTLLMYCTASGEPPSGSKPVKVKQWLINTNKDPLANPLGVLGRILENYIDTCPFSYLYSDSLDEYWKFIEKIKRNLADNALVYMNGNVFYGNLNNASKTLEQFIKDIDVASINQEFDRAISSVEVSPREAVSAASNILESICKVYIEQNDLIKPNKQDLKSLFTVVRKDLNIQTDSIEDEDILKIVSGVISIVDGIAALRTHASSAHGAGSKMYNLQPRHARLAIHSSHTIALFLLESWKTKKS
ncbi:abortive infection family protein [Acinetobacter sp. ANC 4635]|uniref:abortive infection family protein n=1 Tax=Acinetobacter sp. ANC 4635 TaxID=2529846 RepID=UPI0013F17841|nr:abortive infection family protein [Acinetobacter sp. ANC 4635]